MKERNLRTYESTAVVDWYARLNELTPAEMAVLETFKAKIKGSVLLDIGIGAGRTSAFLSAACKEYVGIDYSENFVNAARRKFPHLKISKHDAKDLSAFEGGSFDVVNFSLNGIDYSDAEGRKKILQGICRVLKPGGLFLFSTHNRDHFSFDRFPWLEKNKAFIFKIKTFIKILPYIPFKLLNKKKEIIQTNYAIINDPAHNYGLMTYYVSPGFLRQQLQQAGFGEIFLYKRTGAQAADNELDDWIFVSCIKL